MLKLMNWWPNLFRDNDPNEMTDAWAVSLAPVPYEAAMKAAVDLSRKCKWPPTVADICEAARPYIHTKFDVIGAIDRYRDFQIPLPEWIYETAMRTGYTLPPDILAIRDNKRINKRIE